MRVQWSGVGVGLGAAFGILAGQLLFEGAWWVTLVGAAFGLLAGAVADLQRRPRER